MEFDALEHKLGQLESELLELNANSDRLHRSHNELLELQVRYWQADAHSTSSRSAAEAAAQAAAYSELRLQAARITSPPCLPDYLRPAEASLLLA